MLKGFVPKTLLRRWTITAIECYMRGCVCKGCIYNDFFESEVKCQMKNVVIELVKKIGTPDINIYLKTIQQEVL